MSGLCHGKDRIEMSEALGRPARQGTWAELAVPDAERVRQALRGPDPSAALPYLHYLHAVQGHMLATGVEWLLNWLAWAAREASPAEAGRMAAEAEAAVPGGLGPLPRLSRLDPSTAIGEFRQAVQAGRPTVAAALLEASDSLFARVLEARDDPEAALAAFEDWYAAGREAHDRQIALAWAFASAVYGRLGRAAVERGQHETLAACAFYEGMWQVSRGLEPADVAAMLADHMRAHFSGPGRGGGVRVVEEADRFRLLFEPCGSGQALRRRGLAGQAGFAVLEEPTPGTWNREGVPLYCAHCAQNELDSVRRLGYPLFVTEFDPDPERPCGWTVYKDPAAIPEVYWQRLGLQRPAVEGGPGAADAQPSTKQEEFRAR